MPLKILVVDNDSDQATHVVAAVSGVGREVTHIPTRAAAYAEIQRYFFDVVFLDLMLNRGKPEATFDLLTALETLHGGRHGLIVVYSNYASELGRDPALAATLAKHRLATPPVPVDHMLDPNSADRRALAILISSVSSIVAQRDVALEKAEKSAAVQNASPHVGAIRHVLTWVAFSALLVLGLGVIPSMLGGQGSCPNCVSPACIGVAFAPAVLAVVVGYWPYAMHAFAALQKK